MSMAAGEYVSVKSQADTEAADLRLELRELEADEAGERAELAAIYVGRGLKPELAAEVAKQLMEHDALAAHARDELGMSEIHGARPLQAAAASAAAFALGGAMPLLVAGLAGGGAVAVMVSITSLPFLAILGALAARAGGASIWRGALRVAFWGALAMAITAAVGNLAG
jgi:VIT1/CCC1 family predicted Fe2+/Mn2+ transporter